MGNIQIDLAIAEATIILSLITAEEEKARTGNFPTSFKRDGNEIEVLRDRFGRFTSAETRIVNRVEEIIQEKESAGLDALENFSVNTFGKEFTNAFKKDAQKVLAMDKGLRDAKANILTTSADLYTKLVKGELTPEQLESRMIEANNRFADTVGKSLQGKNSQIDKLLTTIKYLPEDAINRVEDVIGKFNKDVSPAIANAEESYQKMSEQAKSFVDVTIKEGLETLSGTAKTITDKLGTPGKAAQEAYSSVIKAAKEVGKGIKQKIDAAKKAGQKFLKEHREAIDTAVAAVSMMAVGAVGLFTNWAIFDAVWKILAVEGLQDATATLIFIPGAIVWLITALAAYSVGMAVYNMADKVIEGATKEESPKESVVSKLQKFAGLK